MMEIDGVRFFGEHAGELTLEEVWQLQLPVECMLHVTRHFSLLSVEARGRLHRHVEDTYIDARLQTLGSKFHAKIDDPEALLAFAGRRLSEAVTERDIPWVRKAEGYVTAVRMRVKGVEKQELGLRYDDPLGYANVVAITPEIAPSVEQRQRGHSENEDDVLVNVVKGEPVPSDDLVVVLRKTLPDAAPMFTSAFVGSIAPSLPRKYEQTPEEFAYSTEWWARHAFIVS